MNSSDDGRERSGPERNPAGSSTRTLYLLLAIGSAAGILWLARAAIPRAVRAVPSRVVYDTTLANEARGYTYGRPDAPVQIVEFADFECPGCAQFAARDEPLVRRGLIDSGRASLVFMDFPLEKHHNSRAAHNAAACADAQHGFWAMHDSLYASQAAWNSEATSTPRPVFVHLATAIGLDVPRWELCFDARQFDRRILANHAEGLRRQVGGTPTIFINGQGYTSLPYARLAAIVDSMQSVAHGTVRESLRSQPVSDGVRK